MSKPMVSICMPAYNVAAYIDEAIGSVMNQTYENWELIIVNDGSVDQTSIIAKKWSDTRIKVLDSTNRGAAAARNLALQIAIGDYVIFLDADDLLEPGHISSNIARIGGTDNTIVLSDWQRFGSWGKGRIETSQLEEILPIDWIRNYWYKCTTMTNPGRFLIPMEVIRKAGVWNETLSLNDDMEFFTRIMFNVDLILFNHSTVLLYRSQADGLSSRKDEVSLVSLYRSLELSSTVVLENSGNDSSLRRCCANMYQNFIYEAYPFLPGLLRQAHERIVGFGGSDLHFPAGGYTRILSCIIGWRLTKIFKIWRK